MSLLQILSLEGASDPRGDSFNVPNGAFHYIGSINEMHYVTIAPGSVRGNHYHRGRKEIILLVFDGSWKLAWRSPNTESVTIQEFDGKGGKILLIDPGVVHAIKNTGDGPLQLVSCSNLPSTPTDTERVVLLK